MRSIAIPSLSHRTEGFDKLNSALGLAKGTPLSEQWRLAILARKTIAQEP
jgi:hypothetical protein